MPIQFIKVQDSSRLPLQVLNMYQIKNKQNNIIGNMLLTNFNTQTNKLHFTDGKKKYTLFNDPGVNYIFKRIIK